MGMIIKTLYFNYPRPAERPCYFYERKIIQLTSVNKQQKTEPVLIVRIASRRMINVLRPHPAGRFEPKNIVKPPHEIGRQPRTTEGMGPPEGSHTGLPSSIRREMSLAVMPEQPDPRWPARVSEWPYGPAPFLH